MCSSGLYSPRSDSVWVPVISCFILRFCPHELCFAEIPLIVSFPALFFCVHLCVVSHPALVCI